MDLGYRLLVENGGLAGIGEAPLERLARSRAVGKAKASSLVAAFELGRRAASQEIPLPIRVRDAGDIVALARRHVDDYSREVTLVIVLTATHRLLRVQRLTIGTETRCLLEPCDVMKAVLSQGGAAFAVVHTHPS